MKTIANNQSLQEYASELAGNWQSWQSFILWDNRENAHEWAILYTENDSSDILDQFVAQAIAQEVEKRQIEEIEAITCGHDVVHEIRGFFVRCLADGKPTAAIQAWREIQAAVIAHRLAVILVCSELLTEIEDWQNEPEWEAVAKEILDTFQTAGSNLMDTVPELIITADIDLPTLTQFMQPVVDLARKMVDRADRQWNGKLTVARLYEIDNDAAENCALQQLGHGVGPCDNPEINRLFKSLDIEAPHSCFDSSFASDLAYEVMKHWRDRDD